MSISVYTADQIETAVITALQNRDVHAVPPLLRLLALQDPDRAQSFLDAIQFGISLRQEEWSS